ncbi:putative glycogenin [Corchorus capsularis]|uniref:Putative glycogenin n=1 Tax=Corchorus capsularis TaxID=210143 RepID=A0A1R3IPN4_COCAP|nr:putative glycogenin [Corchorus capsularis]
MADHVLDQPRLRAFGARLLASEVLSDPEPFKSTRCASMARVNWMAENLTQEQIECTTTDAYAAYKVGKKLLGV